jgi:S1-C subfamily serine protease
MEDLVEFGHVRRPRIGVRIAAVSAEDAEAYGLPSVSGILVQGVNEGGPSDGQLEAEDVIVAIEDEPVGYVAELQARVAEFRPGDRIKVSLYRDGRLMDAEIRLDEAPINEIPTVVTVRTGEPDERLGINVEVVDLEEIASLGWENADGVFLTQVARGSPADRRGVGGYLGTKIVRVQDVAISTPADVRRALGGVDPGEIVSLHFEYPNGDQQVVNVRMPR